MKTDRRNFLKQSGLVGVGLMVGCSQPKSSRSLNDLKVAYVREATTQEKYSKFAIKAKEENFPKIATMFNAIAKAEGIHAANHQKVIKKLKGTYPDSPVEKFDVKSTLENLQNGLQTENYEIETMYPSFIKEAEAENQADAVNAFTWAYKVEFQHRSYYNLAITAFGTGSEVNLPGIWYVCPRCGGTYAKDDLKNTCYFDPTPKEQFLEFI